jgi:hypothetical protein
LAKSAILKIERRFDGAKVVCACEARTEVSNSALFGLGPIGADDRTDQADKAIVPNSKRSQS